MPRRAGAAAVRRRLEQDGVLLLQDATLPSVATLVAGEVVRGSWWGHPAGQAIFALCERLEEDAVSCKLVQGKVTFVHQRLWSALLGALGSPRQAWQRRGLSQAARTLRRRLQRLGSGRVDELGDRAAAKELEQRLLVLAVSEHTESGRHEKRLTDWNHWAQERGVKALAPSEARAALREAVPAGGILPWE